MKHLKRGPVIAGLLLGVILSNYGDSIADVHTHPGGYAPSAEDLQSFYQLSSQLDSFETRFIVTKGGSSYAMTIDDPSKFSDFIADNPGMVAGNNNFAPGTDAGALFNEVKNYFTAEGYTQNEAYELATAQVFKEAGVTLLKADPGSDHFESLKIDHVTGPNGEDIYIPYCT